MDISGISGVLRQSGNGTLLEVYVQPKASRNEVVGVHEGALKIRLTAPPVEGEANKECVRFLAQILGVPKSRVEVIKGFKSRRKTVLLGGLPLETVQNLLQNLP